MAAYNVCLQVSFIVVQLFFIALGGVLIGVGSWLEVEEQTIVAAIEEERFLYGPYLIIAAGAAIVLVAIIGMFGAFCSHAVNRFLLVVYIVLVLVIFAAQLVGGILGFVYREEALDLVATGLNNTLSEYGGSSTTQRAITEAWNQAQNRLDCCGIFGVEDWISSNNSDIPNLLFPDSCCVMTGCNSTMEVHTDGCQQAISDFIENQLLIVAAVGIAFIVGEIIVVLMAFCLLCCTNFEKENDRA